MTAYLVLLSVAGLLGLLVWGRWPAAVLFTVWAGGFFLSGTIDQAALLGSYANPALATLVMLLLVSLAFERSGLLEVVTLRLLKGRESYAALRLMGVVASLSAFLNNTAVVATFLGSVSRQKLIAPSRLLILVSYASILGGVTTLVGTSTNLVVSSFAVSNHLAPIGMFQMTGVGVLVAIACGVVLSVEMRWLPRHDGDSADATQPYFLEARISNRSPLAGRSIEANGLRHLNGLFLMEIERSERLIAPVGPDEVLQVDDVLLFTGEVTRFQALQSFVGLEVFGTRSDKLLNANLVEAVVSSQSELANRTLREVDFRTMFDAGVVGIRRGDKRLSGQLGRIPLKVGDSLLLSVGPDFAQHRNLDRNFHVLGDSLTRPALNGKQGAWALSGFAMVIAAAAAGWLPLLHGLIVLLAVFLATRLVTLAELRRRFPFELLMLIGSALALAHGLEQSGAAALLAQGMNTVFSGGGAMGALIGVYLLTLILTELVTNNAAAALAFPVALATARAWGVDPTAFVMIVAFGASACFVIPFGYQTHMMVWSPGRYRMVDFVRVGLPVSITYTLGVLWLTPIFFPLTPV